MGEWNHQPKNNFRCSIVYFSICPQGGLTKPPLYNKMSVNAKKQTEWSRRKWFDIQNATSFNWLKMNTITATLYTRVCLFSFSGLLFNRLRNTAEKHYCKTWMSISATLHWFLPFTRYEDVQPMRTKEVYCVGCMNRAHSEACVEH